MNVITKPRLREQAKKHGAAQFWIEAWLKVVGTREWTSLLEVQRDYATADHVCNCLIFNVLGNRFRLIVGVWWARGKKGASPRGGKLFFKHLLTHAMYDKNKWRKDCGCDD